MNGVHPSHDLLQRHHDGDLTGQEAAELHVHLDACDKCQAELASLGRLGQLLRRPATEDQLGYGSADAMARAFRDAGLPPPSVVQRKLADDVDP